MPPVHEVVYVGSPGIGEVIQNTPLIRALSKNRAVTLLCPDWMTPAFTGLHTLSRIVTYRWGQDARVEVKAAGRTVYFQRSFLEEHGLLGAHYVSPIVSARVDETGFPDIGIDGKVICTHPAHISLTERMLHRYGFTHEPPYMELVTDNVPLRGSVVIVNSMDGLRRIPPKDVQKLIDLFPDREVVLLGHQGKYPTQWHRAENRMRKTLCTQTTKEALDTVAESALVIGTDNGWVYAGVAMHKPTIIMQSRVLFESLVPRAYWNIVVPFQKPNLRCDRLCPAQKQLALAGVAEGVPRPFPVWEYRVTDTRTPACHGEPYAPCLALSEADLLQIRRLSTKIAGF